MEIGYSTELQIILCVSLNRNFQIDRMSKPHMQRIAIFPSHFCHEWHL